MCVDNCETGYNSVEKVVEGLYKCVPNCNNKYRINTNECVSNCDIPSALDPSYHIYYQGITNTVKTCVEHCPSDKPYLYTNNNECVNSCPHYIENNICVLACSDDTFFVEELSPNDLVTKK